MTMLSGIHADILRARGVKVISFDKGKCADIFMAVQSYAIEAELKHYGVRFLPKQVLRRAVNAAMAKIGLQ